MLRVNGLLTLSQEPNAISCVGVQIVDDRLFEDVEDFVVNLRIPSESQVMRLLSDLAHPRKHDPH